jgi:uncharacterized protein DUF4124
LNSAEEGLPAPGSAQVMKLRSDNRFYAGARITMRRLTSNPWILVVCLMCMLVASSSRAQIYKWVDANGKTHYSEKKEDAGNAKTEELKLKSQPTSPQNASRSEQYWREQERQFQERQAARRAFRRPVAKGPRSLSGGKENGTDASRCALARDVLSGAVKHKNGAPTDSYDRQVAENDVRTFCH